MELRARIRPTLCRAGLMVAAAALLVPLTGTATADAASRPVVKRITPKRVFVGETLTIRGRHFRRGVNKNMVAFKRRGAKVVIVPAGRGTTKLLRVVLPKRLEKVLLVQNGTPVPTRLQVRVMSSRFGKRYTSRSKSPLVGPEQPPAPPKPKSADPNGDCDGDGQINRVDTDDDNDLLSDDTEVALSEFLDPCKGDTDGDGVEDGYEYQSARDLNDDEYQAPNNKYLPYPRKLPYPNPLDGEDGGTDHDGDNLTLLEEFKLWNYAVRKGSPRTLERLVYSAGEQYSLSARAGGTGRRVPTQPAAPYDKQTDFRAWAAANGYATVRLSHLSDAKWWEGGQSYPLLDFDRSGTVEADEAVYYDHFGNGMLDDSERDEDADGLSNWAETRGCMQPGWWASVYTKESPYYVTFGGTRLDDEDSDGDGVRDGADDQDHDDIPNIMECSRRLTGNASVDSRDATAPIADGTAEGWVNPFNPCLPYRRSRSCSGIVTIGAGWAPWDTKPSDIYWVWY